LIQGAFDEEQDLRQTKNIFFISQIHCYYDVSGSAAKPNHTPTLEERVDTLSNQVILLISHFQDSTNKSVEMAMPDDEVDGFFIT